MGRKVIQNSVSIAANSTNLNVLQGLRFENIKQFGLIDFYGTGSAAGMFATLYVGERNAVERSAINSQNRFPVDPDDLVVADIEAAPGEKIQLQVENTTAGALTFFYKLVFDDNVEVDI